MNLSAGKLIRSFFDKFFWRQHPETALRYSPVVSAIRERHLTGAKILEVGSGSLGIVPYLKQAVDGLDVAFEGPQTDLLKKIKGQADNLPFRKNSYDVVISVDTLEHLNQEERGKSLFEIMRVAKKLAVIVVPVGRQSEEQDQLLDARWKRIFKEKNQFFEDHLKNGLPRTEDVLVQIDKSIRQLGKKAKITSKSNLNLGVRYILMKTYITKNKFFYYLYLKGYLLFLPILKLANFGKCYRRVFVIEFSS